MHTLMMTSFDTGKSFYLTNVCYILTMFIEMTIILFHFMRMFVIPLVYTLHTHEPILHVTDTSTNMHTHA